MLHPGRPAVMVMAARLRGPMLRPFGSWSSRVRSAGLWGSATRSLQVVDLHCAGEPARVVLGGLPRVRGASAFEMRTDMMERLDHCRRLLIEEPRGYPCQNVNFVLPSTREDAAYAVVVGEQGKIYPLMSGHNTICTATALLELGLVPTHGTEVEFALEMPGGLVTVAASVEQGRATRVALRNVPSFVHALDLEVQVPTVGKVKVDIAYGGMHYCIVDAASVGLALRPENGKQICRLGEMIKVACREQHPVQHPEMDYPGCDILAFREGNRNAVVMTNGVLDWERDETWTAMIDRSPCGTGTSAIMAVMAERGELKEGDVFRHCGILDTVFEGRIVGRTTVAGKSAIFPEISGRAWITQKCEVLVDPTDPFPAGYTVSDIWG